VAEVGLEPMQDLMQRVLSGRMEAQRERTGMRREQMETRREQAAMRRESAEVRSLVLLLSDQGRRVERRVGEGRNGIELMAELGPRGCLGHAETRTWARLDALTAPAA